MAFERAPLLFLDFDGVLHPASDHATAAFSRALLLEKALAGLEVRLVVSSSWRFHYSLADIQSRLPAGVASRVIGVTGEPQFGEFARHREILAWLAEARRVAPWRALDDSAFEFPKGRHELILCDPSTGLDDDIANLVRDWLERVQP